MPVRIKTSFKLSARTQSAHCPLQALGQERQYSPRDLSQPSGGLVLPAGPHAPRFSRRPVRAADLALLPANELVQRRDPAHVDTDFARDGSLTEQERESERPFDVDQRGRELGVSRRRRSSAGTHGIGKLKVGLAGEVEDGCEPLVGSAVRCREREDLGAGC